MTIRAGVVVENSGRHSQVVHTLIRMQNRVVKSAEFRACSKCGYFHKAWFKADKIVVLANRLLVSDGARPEKKQDRWERNKIGWRRTRSAGAQRVSKWTRSLDNTVEYQWLISMANMYFHHTNNLIYSLPAVRVWPLASITGLAQTHRGV